MAKKKLLRDAPAPVLHGDAFHAFITEAQSLGNEVAARRRFDADVGDYLRERGLTDGFEAWRAARVKSRE